MSRAGPADSAPTRTPLANVDSAWLRMDDPTNLMVVTGVLVLDAPVRIDGIREILVGRLLTFPRFRQRVVTAGSDLALGTPSWEDDPAFSVDHHLVEAELADPDDERALQAFVGRLASQPLDPAHPLWQFHFIPTYRGGSAVVCRVHHAIGDGLALIYVMLTLADGGGEPPSAARAGVRRDGESGPWDAVARSIDSALTAALALPANALRELGSWLSNPSKLVEATGQAGAAIGSLGRLLLMEPDPDTRLRGPLVRDKRVVWSRALRVADMKRVGKVTGATVNDVLMAALSGALRRYLSANAPVDPRLNLRGVVPVNLRPLSEAYQLGNQFGLVFLSLPVGIEEPLDRLFEVRKRMDAIKRSPEAYVAFQILKAIGAAPRQIFELVVQMFSRKATAVVTNVIGPREPIFLAGTRLRQAMFWVPCAGRLGLGVSLLSYAGEVWIGIQTDAGLIPDPERILEAFYEEIDQLVALADQVGA